MNVSFDPLLPAGATPVTMSLGRLRPGGAARVAGFASGIPLRMEQRLIDLGFSPGADVTVVRRAPFGGPVVYRVADYEICLRRRDAAGVRVVAR